MNAQQPAPIMNGRDTRSRSSPRRAVDDRRGREIGERRKCRQDVVRELGAKEFEHQPWPNDRRETQIEFADVARWRIPIPIAIGSNKHHGKNVTQINSR